MPRLPQPTWSQFAAKLIVALALAYFFARWLTADAAADHVRAAALTHEAYLADFETYRAGLTTGSRSFTFNAFLSSLLVVGLFGLYELLAHGVALVLERVVPAPGGPGEAPRGDGPARWPSPAPPTPREAQPGPHDSAV